MNNYYLGNPNLLSSKATVAMTQDQVDEFIKCANDPIYFIKQYIKIVNLDRGLINFELWPFQEDMVNTFHTERFSIVKVGRQSGKSTTVISYLLHYALFNENVSIAILANKAATSRELLHRLKLAYEYLPNWLKQGIVTWNKGDVEFGNGSRILASATSASSIRGLAINLLYLDEFAIVPNGQAEEFFASTYPTISSGKTSKVIITSTPLGLNLFYRMWTDAVENRSSYKAIEVHWSQIPGRDQKWKEETIRNTSEEQFRVEFEAEFVGSTNTLISSSKLRSLAFKTPIYQEDHYQEYVAPEKNKTYVICVDVARGQGLDYSAFSILDVSQIPYVQVAKYKCNTITPLLYPTVILQKANRYNDAFLLIETNDIGQQVADILHYELAYENILKIATKGRAGQQVTPGFVKKMQLGLKTSVQVKRIGCANLKTLVENDKLLIMDSDTIMELTTFSADKQSFAAEEGNNDDLAMTLVFFGWLASQRYFKESVMNDIRTTLQQEQLNIMDQDLVPFGIIDDGLKENYEIDNNGDIWTEAKKMYPFDDWNWEPKL